MTDTNFAAAFERANREFSDDAEFFTRLLEARVQQGFRCKKCGCTDFQFRPKRKIVCNGCKRRTSVTAGTPFEGMSHCRPMMTAIRLRESGIEFNPSQLAKAAGVSYSTAFEMFKRINLVLVEHLQQSTSALHCVEVAEVLFRRSRESKPDLHPASAVLDHAANNEQEADTSNPRENIAVTKLMDSGPEAAKQIYLLLSAGALHTDALLEQLKMDLSESALHLFQLEFDGLIRRLPGDRYEIAASSPSQVTKTCTRSDARPDWTEKFVSYCRQYFQGISRKYVQAFLVLFWYGLRGINWGKDGLFIAFIRHEPISRRQIIAFVSPMVLAIPA